MDNEKRQELIEAAKAALKRTEDFPAYPEAMLIKIHKEYLGYDHAKTMTVSEWRRMHEDGKKACKKFLRESRRNHYLDVGREAVERTLEILEMIVKHWEESGKEGPRGRRIDMKLYRYIWAMAGWYYEFIGQPAYGTHSKFPDFLSTCLSVLDDAYQKKTPQKMIQRVVREFRKKYPDWKPPMLLDE